MFRAGQTLKAENQNRSLDQYWQDITGNYCVDEKTYLNELLPLAEARGEEQQIITDTAKQLIKDVRNQDDSVHMVDALLQEYSLDTQEGILLMCLAEALMRVPDKKTADALIRDKISAADWNKHLGRSESVLVNASTWGLLLTGRVVKLEQNIDDAPGSVMKRLVNQCGEPVIRGAINQAMKIMGKQFVLGENIGNALRNGSKNTGKGYSYSFDMLGEAALTEADAKRYFESYLEAINSISSNTYFEKDSGLTSISIKLSALHPRYEQSQEDRVLSELYETVLQLINEARNKGVAVTIDAEEMDRLELSLRLFKKLYSSYVSIGWGELGIVVQAYSKRALPVLCWLNALAREQGDEIPVRLVKGAYWDSEIKWAQQRGLPGYPVFTRKEGTDVSYLACMRYMLSEHTRGALFPQFATHNAHTAACALTLAGWSDRNFEFQRLHGMGDALYNAVLGRHKTNVRIYAPVGAHKDLLPYLVRRLLENGANSSFVHRLVDADTPVDDLVNHPTSQLKQYATFDNEHIALPENLYGNSRKNSTGVNLFIENQFLPLNDQLENSRRQQWKGYPIVNGMPSQNHEQQTIYSPQDNTRQVGSMLWSRPEDVAEALNGAYSSFNTWNATPVDDRAACLEKFADLLEKNIPELMALCCQEAGKTMQDCVDEIREAVDFCRFYAHQARSLFAQARTLPSPTGESNELYLEGRGVFVCISPWNFPLAIFVGQISAALAAGNTVIAKPAEQTSLIATKTVELMHKAGVPGQVLQLLPGDGAALGKALLSDERIHGVVFTGSTNTARLINRTLANRDGAIATLIAETGGQNAMIVDSTALPEQVIIDVVQSAFSSAGQRCSALRVLYLQEDIADDLMELLEGALHELRIGDPALLSTDVGPVIDAEAQKQLLQHIAKLKSKSGWGCQGKLDAAHAKGFFVAPSAYEIDDIKRLKHEHFGPILHVIRFAADKLDQVIDSINATGFGLTLGIHSRNESTAAYIERSVKVGNTYINRNQIGAVVGVQPFGGHGLSGTGPKAGGPHYLLRFATERTRTTNTAAVGGNATLLSLGMEHV